MKAQAGGRGSRRAAWALAASSIAKHSNQESRMKHLFTIAALTALIAAPVFAVQETETPGSDSSAVPVAEQQEPAADEVGGEKAEGEQKGEIAADPPAAVDPPQIEVCFVLDTTGSMGGLIQGAKDKIWSIANQMIAAENSPEIKFGLVGYRDRTDEAESYITVAHDLTSDVDEVFTNLMAFDANGGGDTPESVNQALHESVTQMAWSDDRKVLKIIFLVGDAPPHVDYDEMQYPDICRLAMEKDLIINTIQCGSDSNTTTVWNDIARKAEGAYAAIAQTGGVVAIATPFDAEIGELNGLLNATVLGYGSVAEQTIVQGKLAVQSAAGDEAVADRASFYSGKRAAEALPGGSGIGGGGRGWTNTVISGGGDLVQEIMDGNLTLDNYDAEQLPDDLKSLSPEEQKLEIARRVEQRKEVREKMDQLVQQRNEFIMAEKEKLAAAGEGDAFDAQVEEMIVDQAERKGIEYGDR